MDALRDWCLVLRRVVVNEVNEKSRSVGRLFLYSCKLSSQILLFPEYPDQHIDDDDLDSLTIVDRSFFMKVGYAWTP